ncbi:MAG: hypothetical protein K2P81_07295 [Bacteriovoracaceae bacterium]|nr:hypothetical protein [Bacteriovoracaceae bacterium]
MNSKMPQGSNELTLRKEDHLSMAQASQTQSSEMDSRFFYEPLLSAHSTTIRPIDFGGHRFELPLWISSMTGGAKHAKNLNSIMARACHEFGLGMGLGSCRPMLDDENSKADFDVRSLMPKRPLFANLGIAQVEKLLASKSESKIKKLVSDLKADGLIVHINPLQEWFQPGGDQFEHPPLETIQKLLTLIDFPLMVKEVGHGMGPQSLRELMKLPLFAIEFGAFGGTNFSVLESMRSQNKFVSGLTHVGHTAQEMVGFVKAILASGEKFKCDRFIISGGVKDSLEGYALVAQLPEGRALFGMANSVLKAAQLGDEALAQYLKNQSSQYAMAQSYLRPKF